MNKYNAETFKSIRNAVQTYQREVTHALHQYRQTMNTAKQAATAYKNESAYIESKRDGAAHTARNDIAMAENVFSITIRAEVDGLRDELDKHLVTAPSDRFLASLNVYATYGLTPGRAEINALMEQAGGNSLALRALDAVLKQTHSKYRVRVPGADDFEKDLDALGRWAEGHLMWRPHEYHSEVVDIYKDTPHMVRRADGNYFDGGYRWDSIGVLSASGDFDQRVQDLDSMAERWTSSVLPVVYDSDMYPDGEQEYVNDYHATAKAGEIIDNPDAETERIRAEAEVRVQENTKAQTILESYTRGTTA